ncbi:hypothetical protein G7054_g7183 [Neopestalotiopsis clavispora]|nr:hypothetical protein G7054_g7183 [Neopestalotiopsis clavispora]
MLGNIKNQGSWALFEKTSKAGGLSSTDTTEEGFLVDYGGHVVFSHYKFFDECLDEALPREEDWCQHQRISYIRYKDRWVPYPFQNNLAALPVEDQVTCLGGLIDAAAEAKTAPKPKTFDEWMLLNLGEGIANCFMRPYTWKVWATRPTKMQCSWLGERVPAPDAKKAATNILKGVVQGNWGPNATFRFPSAGGTGRIWQNLARTLPQDRLRYNKEVSSIDEDEKIVTLRDGKEVHYEHLITTMPLDLLVSKMKHSDRYDICDNLAYSSTNVVLIGIRGVPPEAIASTCWLYFSADFCPFYRATLFSNYAPGNVPPSSTKLPTIRLAGKSSPPDPTPKPGPYWSLLLEVSESAEKTAAATEWFLQEQCIWALLDEGILEAKDEIVSLYHTRCKHGYPTPNLERDSVLCEVLPALQDLNIYSRGRFGSWKYEVSNQDHSFMLGVEAVDHILFGATELSLLYPDVVNGRANNERTLRIGATKQDTPSSFRV